MSGTSVFLRRSCWEKSDSKTPVSTPSNIKVCEIESLIRGQDKILSAKECALANKFLLCLFPFKETEFGTWDFFQHDTLEAPTLQLPEYLNSCCCYIQKQGREQTAPYQDNWLMTGRVITFMSCNPFSHARRSLLSFQVVFFRESNRNSFWKFDTWCLFNLCRFLLRRIRRGTW